MGVDKKNLIIYGPVEKRTELYSVSTGLLAAACCSESSFYRVNYKCDFYGNPVRIPCSSSSGAIGLPSQISINGREKKLFQNSNRENDMQLVYTKEPC